MDKPLLLLAQAAGLATTGSHEWPEHVDEDIAEFIAASDARAMFVVEQPDGLIIGPPPKLVGDVRVLAVAKPAGPLSAANWDREVAAVILPANASLFKHLHTLTGQVILPLLDAPGGSESTASSKQRLVEAERALASLLQHQHVAFVDLIGGWGARAKRALAANDLNELQGIANAWKRALTQLACSDRDVRQGSASDEAGFWTALEDALRSAEAQLRSPEVSDVVDTLERAKRFHATHNFVGDTGLPETITRVAGYQLLFKDLALGELLASQSFSDLGTALDAIFAQISRRLRMSGYPIQRSVLFVEAIGKDFANVLARLAEQALDELLEATGEFTVFARAIADLSEAWDSHVRDFASLARDLMRRRAERFVVVRVKPSHTSLTTRVRAIENLWSKHRDLHPLVGSELDDAFETIMHTKGLLQLDDAEWRRMEAAYARAAHTTEKNIAESLRVELHEAGSDAERFEIFSKHRAVLSRPEVRAVIHQFQASLAQRIRADLADLQGRARRMPPRTQIVRRIISMRALAIRVDQVLKRTAAVLGSDWRSHADGSALAADCEVLETLLDTKKEVDAWSSTLSVESILKGPVLLARNGKLVVSANESHIHDDIRELRALGFRFDPSVVQFADQQGEQELFHRRIKDCINDFDYARTQLLTYPRICSVPTVRNLLQQMFVLVRAGLTEVDWQSEHISPFINTFEQVLAALSSRVAQVATTDIKIGEALHENSRQPRDMLDYVQNLATAVAVPEYARVVSHDLTRVVNSRCSHMLSNWRPKKVFHRIEVRDQVVMAVPELTHTLETWLSELNSIVAPVLKADKRLFIAYGHCAAKISAELQTASETLRGWLALQPLWDLRVDAVAEKVGSDIPRWITIMEEFRNKRSILHKSQRPTMCVQFQVGEARTLLDAKCDAWQDGLTFNFSAVVSSHSLELMTGLRRARDGLESVRFELKTILSSLMALSQAEASVRDVVDSIPYLERAGQVLSRSRYSFPPTWIYADQLVSELTALQHFLDERLAERDAIKPRLTETLMARLKSLDINAQHLQASWLARKPLQGDTDAESALQILSQFKDDFLQLRSNVSDIDQALMAFDSQQQNITNIEPYTALNDLDDIRKEIESLESAWLALQESDATLQGIGNRKWSGLVITDLKRDLESLSEHVNDLPPRTQQLRAYESLVKAIKMRREACELVALLRDSTSIRVHHLAKLVERKISDDPKLEEIWLNLPDRATVIATIESAEGETQLLKYLSGLEHKWAELILEGRGVALRNLDSVLQLAADHRNALSAMRSSPFFGAVSSTAQAWEQRLSVAQRVFDRFVDVQRQFVYLRGVLSAPSVQAILPNETRRFRIVNDEFTQMYSAAAGRPALEFSSETRLASNLGRLHGQLTTLHRSLISFLESQRKRFARFYFVGDDDLLEIVGTKVEEWGWKHLPSIFPGVATLDTPRARVSAVVSPEGEKLTIEPVPFADDNVEFLLKLESAIKDAVRVEVVRAAQLLSHAWNSPHEFGEWLQNVPCQAALVALRAQWTSFIRGRNTYMEHYNSLLRFLSRNDYSDNLLASRRREAIIAELSYQVSRLHPPYTELELQIEVCEGSVFLKLGEDRWEYGYEYLGVPEVHVRTPLTSEFFFAATTAVAQGLGVSAVGPAGTGKTESVKALGSLFGRRVVVFNCDEAFDFSTVARIIQGCANTSGWACFDEFNRLNRKVLSSVAQLVSESVSKTAPIFVTMNPGYAGRTLLPPNMRPQFREFVMAAADSTEIARVLLYAQGLENESIGHAAVSLLSRMAAQATKQKHYDWGLRTLKGVLRLCRLLHGSVKLACEIAVRPRLVTEDRTVFDKQIEELFGKSSNELIIPGDVDLTKSTADEFLKPYILSLDRFLRLSTGVILLGKPCSGKTTIWRHLAERVGADCVVFDPSAMSKRALFGWLDRTTREWTDGLFTRVLRKVSNNLRGEQTRPWYLIFDGEVEPDWAETLNSVLDDNHRLTLPTGEILPIPDNVHLIFETTSLLAATPATVSRCSVVYIPPIRLDAATELKIGPLVVQTAEKITHAMNFSFARAMATYNALNLESRYLSLAWALAGDSDEHGRHLVAQALRDHADDELPPGDLTQYYVSALTGQWHLWSESVAPSELEVDAITRPELVVSTAETAAHEALLQAALRSHKPLLLVGPPGSGKTMTLFNALRQSPQLVLISVSFSASSTPDVLIKALELHCEYSLSPDGTRVLAPAGTRWAALFIDEINLPEPNSNGVVATTQFLRHIVEYQGFYDRLGEFVRLERVQIVGACNPPPGRPELPERFLRHLAVVQVSYPSSVSLRTIYASFLGSFGAQNLTEPMLSAYERIAESLPNEIWTPRELTRWTRGIYTAWTASSESQHSSLLLYQLWLLEGKRVLGDRLPLEEQQMVEQILEQSLPEPVVLPGVWTYFMTQRPQFVSLKSLRDFLASRLSVFVEEAATEGDSSLVIHDAFVEHAIRVDRIIRQPQGHALLVGPHCTGKVTIVRFVCWLCGLEVIRLRSHANYTDTEFTRDLRRMLIASVRRPVCFIVAESALLQASFVEKMNSLLANGEVPGIFDTHELAAELEEACRRAGFVSGDLTAWFRQRVVTNVHVVFTATRLKGMSPALLNRCYVNQMREWDTLAKRQIADHWLSRTELRQPVVEAMALLPCTGHEFLEFCFQMKQTYMSHTLQLEETQRHFVGGGDRLKEAVLEIAQLKRTLDSKRNQLDSENRRSAEVLSQMLQSQSEAERKRVSAFEIQAAVRAQTSEIEKRREEAHKDLAKTQPMLEQASRGVQNIRKAQLNELRGFTNPPEPVKITLEAVCLILGLFTDGSWRQVLTAVRSDEFIPRILRFDSMWLSTELVERIEHDYMALPSFTFERVDRASKACGPLLLWVVAQVSYAKALASVQPLLTEVEQLNSQAVESAAQLEAIESMLRDLEIAIESAKTDYSKAIAQCESIKSEISLVGSQLQHSETLLQSLQGEQGRWAESASRFQERKSVLAGNSFIEAALVAIGGGRDPIGKQELLTDLKGILDLHGITYNSVDEVTSSEIAQRSSAVALVVDPANRWYRDDATKNTSFLLNADALLKELDTALRFGQHIIIEHAERYDPLLAPLLNKEYTRRGVRLLVNLAGEDIDVAPGFRLTLHARDRRAIAQSQPDLLFRVTLIDFSVSPSTYSQLVRDALLEAHMPELAKRRAELMALNTTTEKRLRSLESQLLTVLAEASGSGLLDNAGLLHSLETLKTEAAQLERVRASTKSTLNELEEAYDTYESAAQSAASVYEAVGDFCTWDPFYVVNVDWMCAIMQKCASSDEFERTFIKAVYARLSHVVRTEHQQRLATTLERAANHSVGDCRPLTIIELIEEAPSTVPVVIGMATARTVDPGSRLATTATVHCSVVAMGSSQSASRADRLLGQAMELGEWLIIQNIELADEDWLRSLARRLQGTQPAPQFRLIFSGMQEQIVEMHSLLSSGRPLSIESIEGVASQLQSILSPESDDRDIKLCWVHASFSTAFPECNFVFPDLVAARWFARQIRGWGALGSALMIAVYGAKTGDKKVKEHMARFLEAYGVEGSTPIDFSTGNWISSLPHDSAWVPLKLRN